MAYVYLDLETTGLDSQFDQITEIAWIFEDGAERQIFVEHKRLPTPWVLESTDYLTRILPAPKTSLLRAMIEFASSLDLHARQREKVVTISGTSAIVTEDIYLVGACPTFDDRFLRRALNRTAVAVPYHYHVIDVEAMAMGLLGHAVPCKLSELRSVLGITGENEAPHTALGDAREVKLIFEAIQRRQKELKEDLARALSAIPGVVK